MRKTMVAVVVALALVMMAGRVGAQPAAMVVGGTDVIGPAAVTDWHTVVDVESATLTVYGVVQNRSNATLSDVRVAVTGAETKTATVAPATLCPGEFGVFGATVRYGADVTARASVTANIIPAPRFVPFATSGGPATQ